LDHLRIIENVTKKKMVKKPIPSLTDVLAGNQQATINKITKTVEENEYAEYKRVAESLLEEQDSVTLLAAALKLLTKEPDATPVKLTAVEPLRSKKPKKDYRSGSGGGGRRRRSDRPGGERSYDRSRGGNGSGGERRNRSRNKSNS